MIGLRARCAFALAFCVLAPGAPLAGEADVIAVKVKKTGPGVFSFDVTVRHGDTGWKHYANKWDVATTDGRVLGTRTLFHPHETEQPFTRSLSGVRIAKDITTVEVRAYDKVHGDGGATKIVRVPHQ